MLRFRGRGRGIRRLPSKTGNETELRQVERKDHQKKIGKETAKKNKCVNRWSCDQSLKRGQKHKLNGPVFLMEQDFKEITYSSTQ